MRRFYLNQDGKPCIWPVPADCLWIGGRYDPPAKVSVNGDFAAEARQLASDLASDLAGDMADAGVLPAEDSNDFTGIRLLRGTDFAKDSAGIMLLRSPDSIAGDEGYSLEVDSEGVRILAATAHGAFNGGRTLLQMVRNSFDPSICGVRISDRPLKPFRGVEIPFPDKAEMQWFLRFVDVMSGYKMNRLLLGIGNPADFDLAHKNGRDWDDEVVAIAARISSRHMEVILCVEIPVGAGFTDESGDTGLWTSPGESDSWTSPGDSDGWASSGDSDSWISPGDGDPWISPEDFRLFDALEKTINLFGAKTVSVDFKDIGPLFNAKTIAQKKKADGASGQTSGEKPGKTAAMAFAERICKVHAWLAERGVGLALHSDKLHPVSGSGRIAYREKLRCNVRFPSTAEAIDHIPKDILILDISHGGISEDTGSEAYFSDHGFKSVFGECSGPVKNWESRISRGSIQGAYVSIAGANSAALGSSGNMLAAIMRISLLLWWPGFRADHTSLGCLLPLHLEREIAQLYPVSRDWLEGNAYPSAQNPGYNALELRAYYNSPLQHSYWRVDDHFMMFLQDAMSLPNAVPFSLFQGVLDFRFENAFIMAGGSWNSGILGIPVNRKAGSLSFLHAYIIGKQQFIAGKDPALLDKAVGQYTIRYADGTTECAEVIFGRNIYSWKNYYGTNQGAYDANPVLIGISDEGLHFTIYAMEWVNGKPDVEIATVDVTPASGMDGRISLFGITAVK